MNVSLTPHLEAMVREKVASGRYNDSSEVVREAPRLLEEQDKLHRPRAAIAVGQEQIRRGEGILLTPEVMADIDREVDELIRRAEPLDPDVTGQ
ncbi:MAG: type II toxin-antitoxin system ParD family antitoxin [Chloroflexia bacterium]|nr:type II toxin-antitoxin system ParD family antitoxin [Chloroflexia bacterium]